MPFDFRRLEIRIWRPAMCRCVGGHAAASALLNKCSDVSFMKILYWKAIHSLFHGNSSSTPHLSNSDSYILGMRISLNLCMWNSERTCAATTAHLEFIRFVYLFNQPFRDTVWHAAYCVKCVLKSAVACTYPSASLSRILMNRLL